MESLDQLHALVGVLANENPTTAELGLAIKSLRANIDRLEGVCALWVAEADRSQLWKHAGASSLSAWLANHCRQSHSRGNTQAKLAEALAASSDVADAVVSGRMPTENAAALTPVLGTEAFEKNGAKLLKAAETARPAELRRKVSEFQAEHEAEKETARAERLYRRRNLRIVDTADGMAKLDGLFDMESARIIRNAIGFLVRADRNDETGRSLDQRRADALVDLCDAFAKGTVTGGRERPTVNVVCSLENLEQRAGRARTTTGETLSAEAFRRIMCDAKVNRVVMNAESKIVDFGRGKRLINDDLYQALVARDQGCRGPDCDRPPEWCDGHHIVHYGNGQDGETNPDNCGLFCRHHHHLLHEGGWKVHWQGTTLVFTSPTGQILYSHAPTRTTAA
jgi:Domain of unknown function (DUF222)